MVNLDMLLTVLAKAHYRKSVKLEIYYNNITDKFCARILVDGQIAKGKIGDEIRMLISDNKVLAHAIIQLDQLCKDYLSN